MDHKPIPYKQALNSFSRISRGIEWMPNLLYQKIAAYANREDISLDQMAEDIFEKIREGFIDEERRIVFRRRKR